MANTLKKAINQQIRELIKEISDLKAKDYPAKDFLISFIDSKFRKSVKDLDSMITALEKYFNELKYSKDKDILIPLLDDTVYCKEKMDKLNNFNYHHKGGIFKYYDIEIKSKEELLIYKKLQEQEILKNKSASNSSIVAAFKHQQQEEQEEQEEQEKKEGDIDIKNFQNSLKIS